MGNFEENVKETLEAILLCVEANAKIQKDTTSMFFEIVKNQEAHYQRVLDRMEDFLERITKEGSEMIMRSEARVGKINSMVEHLVSLDESARKANLEYLGEYKHHIRRVCDARDKALEMAKTLTALVEHLASKPVISNSNSQV
ncbi:MAG: hypothetical protein MJZ26_08900 [Fibrobacter sp.]|nr:hypothetical protein [Fibrobacter sp.]